MRFERLVIEADENTFSLDFHPRLTVICGVGRLEREGVISELVGSLSSSRPGVHAEIVADNGNRFAIFRPFGARARVVDVDTAADVSARFADHDGHVDLLAVADLDPRSAKRVLRMTAADLTATSHHDEHVRRLARADPDELWEAAARVTHARAELDQAAKDAGSEPEDAAVVAQIEEQHQRFEGAQARAEKLRRASFIGGALAALAAVPSATLVSQLAAQPAAIPGILLHVGVGPLVDWIGHYARLGLYTAAHRLGRGVALGALPPRARLAAELKRDELKYGAGLDYEM